MNELQVTFCRHNETGQETNIATDALPGWQKLGWEPIGESHSLEELQTAAVEAEIARTAAQSEAEAVAEDVEDHTIKEVLDEVGDDPVKAQAALDAENATEKPRKTLVAALTKVAETAPDPDAGAAGDGDTEAGQTGNPEGN